MPMFLALLMLKNRTVIKLDEEDCRKNIFCGGGGGNCTSVLEKLSWRCLVDIYIDILSGQMNT
jgi:hypothetical protein